ncbi:DUF1287 domain-containing protein [Fimbriimonas ginsengisoli]|uniref:DUF1287 domain-containing protein n=1 Tax=Fimbriimonas ginsengisoli Gsoil 348 TaxID=661478 RepID=A0A068NTR0_FIMGI|nr:DUF1287 domain-containing protein [Fimbriimonas ginsengisoli]AIE86747.1 hypothetical protein OP10G_3379 [Fimbriimonas ginsengisoli Gsoil 348]
MLPNLFVLLTWKSPKTVVEGAKLQLVSPAAYCPDYIRIPYPGGDVPPAKGACVDVVIRALRYVARDLQVLIHDDMARRGRHYPRVEAHRDTNIDHRRVPNQIYFFSKYGRPVSTSTEPRFLAGWRPGDLVYWKLPNGLDHCGVISDRIGPRGRPLVIHNLAQTVEEDVLDRWRITAHFRYPVVASHPNNAPRY